MEQPEGFPFTSNTGERMVCKLNKSLYGLKQSGRNWNEMIDSIMKQLGFKQNHADPCLYTREDAKGFIAATVYVDDILTIDDKLFSIKKFNLKLTDGGDASSLLGMRITKEGYDVIIDQTKYIQDVILRFGLDQGKMVKTPATISFDAEAPSTKADKHLYMELVGSLIYASVVTRPDISFGVARAGRFLVDPTKNHMESTKHILRYLKGSADRSIRYRSSGSTTLVGYSDADYAGDTTTRRSTSGFVFTLAGAAISWASKRQPTVALSTTEAEFIAATLAITEAMYLRSILIDLGLPMEDPMILYMDNQSAMIITCDQFSQKRIKHIDIKYKFARERVKEGVIIPKYLETKKMVADVLPRQ
jgi:hypothetical protein